MASAVLWGTLCLCLAGASSLLLKEAPPAPGIEVSEIPTQKLLPEGNLPVVMCGMGGQLFGQPDPVRRLTTKWLQLGGRGLDTAQVYGTEPAAVRAMEAAGVAREDVFILTKLHPQVTSNPSGNIRESVMESLRRLRTDYIDLLLIHSPGPFNVKVWAAMEALHDEGKLRALGVSNFDVPQLLELMRAARVPIALNQKKMNVRQQDTEVLDFCLKNNIVYQAWGPLGQGTSSILREPTVERVAAARGKSAAQVGLRWVLQKGAVLSVQSESSEHQAQDMDLFDWELTAEEMGTLDALSDTR